jgi:hypothetical protein
VARARTETVRALKAAAREHGHPQQPEEEERWTHVRMQVPQDLQPVVDEAVALAARLLGATAPRWQRLEALCEEYPGSSEAADSTPAAEPPFSSGDLLEPAKERLEKEWVTCVFVGARPTGCSGSWARDRDPLASRRNG